MPPHTSRTAAFLRLAVRGFAGTIRLITAKLVLLRCHQVGKGVSVRGIPALTTEGKISIGNRVTIWSHLGKTQISAGPGASIRIGDNTFINTSVIISARNEIHIGRNCQIANHVIIMDNDFHGVDRRDQAKPPARILIEDNVWLATRCTVLKGVTIGTGAVVAAGAVVTKDVPPYTLVAGVPARIIRHITPEG